MSLDFTNNDSPGNVAEDETRDGNGGEENRVVVCRIASWDEGLAEDHANRHQDHDKREFQKYRGDDNAYPADTAR